MYAAALVLFTDLEFSEIIVRVRFQSLVNLIPAHGLLDYIQIVWDILDRDRVSKVLLSIQAGVEHEYR